MYNISFQRYTFVLNYDESYDKYKNELILMIKILE